MFKHEDVRTRGSGNIGASNVWRTYGRWYGVPVVVLDTAKGFVPAFVFSLTVSPLAGVLAGAGAMVGHARPLFLKFEKGGKMVATTGGAFLGVAPLVGAISLGRLARRVSADALRVGRVDCGRAVATGGGRAARLLVAGDRVRGARRGCRRSSCTAANVKRLLHGEENRFVLRRRGAREPRTQQPGVRIP